MCAKLQHRLGLLLSLVLLASCGGGGGGSGGGDGSVQPSTPASTGRLLVGIEDSTSDDVSEFWVSITRVTVETEGEVHVVFPPESSPLAVFRVNLLQSPDQMNILSALSVPAGGYDRVTFEYDGAFARVGDEAITVVPDTGKTTTEFGDASAAFVEEGALSTLVLNFDVELSLSDGSEGRLLLDPQVRARFLTGNSGAVVNEFRATVISVEEETGLVGVSVIDPQLLGEVASIGQLDVLFTEETVVNHGTVDVTGLEGLAGLEQGDEVEVETVLVGSTIEVLDLEIKDVGAVSDLNDDGVDDTFDEPTFDSDIDNDGVPNAVDLDDDGDGIVDTEDLDTDNDGILDADDPDDDNDGLVDSVDLDDDGDGIADEAEQDNDSDGQTDGVDDDDDNDGIVDLLDLDDDNDGINDSDDNCQGSFNPEQTDTDGDGFGDVCDTTAEGVPSEIEFIDFRVRALSPKVIEVRFDTNVRVKASVLCGGRGVSGDEFRTYHNYYVRGLSPNTRYSCKVQAMTLDGRTRTSPSLVARTSDFQDFEVRREHPRILVSPDEISELKRRADGPLKKERDRVLSAANSIVDDSFSDLVRGAASHHNSHAATLAVAFLVKGTDRYADKLFDYAKYLAGRSADSREIASVILPVVSLAYDTLYNDLSSSKRQSLKGDLERLLETAVAARNVEEEGVEGWTVEHQGVLVYAALALYDADDSSTRNLFKEVLRDFFYTFVPVKRYFLGVDGGSQNGWHYSSHSREFPYVLALLALENASKQRSDLLADESSWLAPYANWFLYGLRGDTSFFRKNDNTPQFGFRGKHYLIMRALAGVYEDKSAQWLADHMRETDESGFAYPSIVAAYDLLLYDKDVAPRKPTLPLSYWFRRPGVVMMRESWEPETVVAQFQCSESYTGGHQHLDDLSFAIYYRGGLALDAGMYDRFGTPHHENYYQRTIAHNSITLFESGEKYCRNFGSDSDSCGSDARIANDGGQIMPPRGNFFSRPQGLDDLVNPDAPFHRGGIAIYEDKPEYTYSLGRGAPSYSSKKVNVVDRHFLWLKDVDGLKHPLMMVFDHVDVKDSDVVKKYHLHSRNRISVDGNIVTSESFNRITGQRGSLYQATLLPKDWQIRRLQGSDVFRVDGKGYPPTERTRDDLLVITELEKERVEISPRGRRREDQFLHVLYATERDGSNPSSRLVEADRMSGAAVKNWLVLFANEELSVASTSYKASAGISHLLLGMRPERAFGVFVDGDRQLTAFSSKEGSLRFDLNRGGRVEVR